MLIPCELRTRLWPRHHGKDSCHATVGVQSFTKRHESLGGAQRVSRSPGCKKTRGSCKSSSSSADDELDFLARSMSYKVLRNRDAALSPRRLAQDRLDALGDDPLLAGLERADGEAHAALARSGHP